MNPPLLVPRMLRVIGQDRSNSSRDCSYTMTAESDRVLSIQSHVVSGYVGEGEFEIWFDLREPGRDVPAANVRVRR
jgi:hypothetical protein